MKQQRINVFKRSNLGEPEFYSPRREQAPRPQTKPLMGQGPRTRKPPTGFHTELRRLQRRRPQNSISRWSHPLAESGTQSTVGHGRHWKPQWSSHKKRKACHTSSSKNTEASPAVGGCHALCHLAASKPLKRGRTTGQWRVNHATDGTWWTTQCAAYPLSED